MKCAVLVVLALVPLIAAHPVDPEQIVDQLLESRNGAHYHGSKGTYIIFALNLDNDRDNHHGGSHHGGPGDHQGGPGHHQGGPGGHHGGHDDKEYYIYKPVEDHHHHEDNDKWGHHHNHHGGRGSSSSSSSSSEEQKHGGYHDNPLENQVEVTETL